MIWRKVIQIELTNFWSYTPIIEGSYFRIRHINAPKVPLAWLSQAEEIPDSNYHTHFEQQRMMGLAVYESFRLKKPPIFATRKLAFRQDTRTANNWSIEVEICTMPSYSLDDPTPVNLAASTSKNVTTVVVTTTPSRILLANPLRKDVKFYSADKMRSVYLDTDNVVSAASAVESVTPSRPVCVPFIKWQGEWWAVASAGSVSIEIEEYF